MDQDAQVIAADSNVSAAPAASESAPAAPPKTEGNKGDRQIVVNQATVEYLAGIVKEEHLRLFQADLAQAIANAQVELERQKALKIAGAASAQADMLLGRIRRPVMDVDQQAEWMRVALLRCLGRFNAMPAEHLDADGLITQALTPTGATAGATLVPDEFVAEVVKRAEEPQIIWPLLTHRTTRRRTVKKPEVTGYITPSSGTSANVNSATTATEITATEPTFSEMQWDLEDFDARMPLKLDLIEESAIDAYQELLDLCADGYAIHHEFKPLTGRGHATYQEPLGLLDSSAGITTVAISAAPTVANILDFASEIPLRYRTRASIVCGSDTLYAIIAVLAQNVRAAEFLMNKLPPLLESEQMYGDNQGKLLGGDFSKYVVYAVRLFQLTTSIAAERKTQEIVVTETWTGRPTITDAFRIGTGITYD